MVALSTWSLSWIQTGFPCSSMWLKNLWFRTHHPFWSALNGWMSARCLGLQKKTKNQTNPSLFAIEARICRGELPLRLMLKTAWPFFLPQHHTSGSSCTALVCCNLERLYTSVVVKSNPFPIVYMCIADSYAGLALFF